MSALIETQPQEGDISQVVRDLTQLYALIPANPFVIRHKPPGTKVA